MTFMSFRKAIGYRYDVYEKCTPRSKSEECRKEACWHATVTCQSFRCFALLRGSTQGDPKRRFDRYWVNIVEIRLVVLHIQGFQVQIIVSEQHHIPR